MANLKFVHNLILVMLTAGIPMLVPVKTLAQGIRVAVASNFKNAITTITSHFETNSGHKVTLIFGSTGKHYAQIKHGAPYDIFFAADSRRPELLEKDGIAIPNTRFTYARGKLLLWSPRKNYIDADAKILQRGEFRYIAIANPRLAPYGRAAKEILLARNLWDALNTKIVRGENIGQTFQFIKSGNAELGFVAYSQLVSPKRKTSGSYWEVPQSLYSPIEQQAVIIKDNKVAHEFVSFVRSKEALQIIRNHGYDTP